MADSRRTVIVTEPIHRSGLDLLATEQLVINLPDRPAESIDDYLPTADAIVVRTARLTAERLVAAPRLKVIGKHGVGVDNIDVAAARSRGIAIVSTPGANAEAVAEHALA